jgi:hypothetical protein
MLLKFSIINNTVIFIETGYKMIKQIILLILLSLFSACVNSTNPSTQEMEDVTIEEEVVEKGEFKVTFHVGTINKVAEGIAEAVSINDYLYINETVETKEKSTVDLLYKESGIVRISENSKCELRTVVNDSNDETNMKLDEGKVSVTLSKLKKGNFKVESPTMVAAVRGTTFTVEADTEKTVVSVTEGTVSVTPKNNNTEISKTTSEITNGNKITIINADIEAYEAGTKKPVIEEMTSEELQESSATLKSIINESGSSLSVEMNNRIGIVVPQAIKENITKIEEKETLAAQRRTRPRRQNTGANNTSTNTAEQNRADEQRRQEEEAREQATSIPSI